MYGQLNVKTPKEYIESLEEPRKSEIRELHELIVETVPEFESNIFSGALGYGMYHYKYASGREGDSPIIALASNKNYISLYVMCTKEGAYLAESYKDKLSKANIGKSCIRIRKLADIDKDTLRKLLEEAKIYRPT